MSYRKNSIAYSPEATGRRKVLAVAAGSIAAVLAAGISDVSTGTAQAEATPSPTASPDLIYPSPYLTGGDDLHNVIPSPSPDMRPETLPNTGPDHTTLEGVLGLVLTGAAVVYLRRRGDI